MKKLSSIEYNEVVHIRNEFFDLKKIVERKNSVLTYEIVDKMFVLDKIHTFLDNESKKEFRELMCKLARYGYNAFTACLEIEMFPAFLRKSFTRDITPKIFDDQLKYLMKLTAEFMNNKDIEAVPFMISVVIYNFLITRIMFAFMKRRQNYKMCVHLINNDFPKFIDKM